MQGWEPVRPDRRTSGEGATMGGVSDHRNRPMYLWQDEQKARPSRCFHAVGSLCLHPIPSRTLLSLLRWSPLWQPLRIAISSALYRFISANNSAGTFRGEYLNRSSRASSRMPRLCNSAINLAVVTVPPNRRSFRALQRLRHISSVRQSRQSSPNFPPWRTLWTLGILRECFSRKKP